MKKELFLLDLTNLIYRFHFAFMRRPLRTRDGFNTSAIFGTLNYILDIIELYKPAYIAAALDVKGKTFRHDIYPQYKDGRDAAPDELLSQIPIIRDMLKHLGIKVIGVQGIEADDIIGTLQKKFSDEFEKAYIVTADKDMAQLLDGKSVILSPKKDNDTYRELDIRGIEEKLGIPFGRIIDYYALTGDKVDNIPGVPGIGPKTAMSIINQIDDITDADEIEKKLDNKKQIEKLLSHIEDIELFRKLLRIKTDAGIDIAVDDISIKEKNANALAELLQKYELYSLIERLDVKSKKIEMDVPEGEKISDITKLDTSGIVTMLKGDDGIFIADSRQYGIFDKKDAKKACSEMKGDIIIDSVKHMPFVLNSIDSKHIYDMSILRDVMQNDYSPSKIINDHFRHSENTEGARCAMLLSIAGKDFISECNEHANIGIYRDIELPIVLAIIAMETNGLKVNRDFFEKEKEELSHSMDSTKEEIFRLAGEQFNLNSPKQLSQILFNKLGIEPVKKTKTGYSTDYSVLKELAGDHKIAQELIKYREESKLLSGFVEPILKLSKETGYIHTTLEQSYAATGRFSSKNPNMQNIPPRIRQGFIASDEEHEFFSVDYSQIELRVLAHLSKDRGLLDAFENGRDIHAETAMRIFDVKEEGITHDMRSTAKIINFSVIYGKTAFGLSQELGISRKEADEFIKKYFSDFKGVEDWIEKAKQFARDKGYSQTLFGRIRHIQQINSRNKTIRSQAERIAVNTPIQGTAADIIKIAIREVFDYIQKEKLPVRMLLTIHDELLFEIPKDIDENILKRIEHIMKDVKPLDKLLDINSARGFNWYICKS